MIFFKCPKYRGEKFKSYASYKKNPGMKTIFHILYLCTKFQSPRSNNIYIYIWNFSSKLALKKGYFFLEIYIFWCVDYESEVRFGGRHRKTNFIFGIIKKKKKKN